MNVVIYSRCSTDESRQDVQAQHDKCIQYCKAHNWNYDIVEEYSSAWNKERPKFKQMLEDIRLKQYQVIVCYDLDRFSRDDPHVADAYLNKIVHVSGCRFISLNDNIDSDNEVSWHIVRHVMVWQANKYSQRLSDRIKEGIKTKRQKLGSKFKYGRARKHDYNIIREEYETLGSISGVAKKLGVSKSTVSNAIKGSKRTQ